MGRKDGTLLMNTFLPYNKLFRDAGDFMVFLANLPPFPGSRIDAGVPCASESEFSEKNCIDS
jgi:hypothetical protein